MNKQRTPNHPSSNLEAKHWLLAVAGGTLVSVIGAQHMVSAAPQPKPTNLTRVEQVTPRQTAPVKAKTTKATSTEIAKKPATKPSKPQIKTVAALLISKACGGPGSTKETILTGQAADKNSTMGNIALLCAAEKLKKIPYVYAGGHQGAALFMETFYANGGFSNEAADGVDCSGFLIVSLKLAYNVDTSFNDADFITSTDGHGHPLFKRISLSDVKPGDVLAYPKGTAGYNDGHVGISMGEGFINAENPQAGIVEDTIWNAPWTIAARYIGPGAVNVAT